MLPFPVFPDAAAAAVATAMTGSREPCSPAVVPASPDVAPSEVPVRGRGRECPGAGAFPLTGIPRAALRQGFRETSVHPGVIEAWGATGGGTRNQSVAGAEDHV